MNNQETIHQRSIENDFKQEFEQTLPSRVQRYLKVKPHGIVPYTEFAPASAECTTLFRDGHFYGCISVSQSVAESIARFLCQKNGWRPKKDYEKNVSELHNRHFISEETKVKFVRIWEKRDDYHHLNPEIETDRGKLEELAYEKFSLLKDIESEIFRFSIVDGKIMPENIKYWTLLQNGTTPVYLKLK